MIFFSLVKMIFLNDVYNVVDVGLGKKFEEISYYFKKTNHNIKSQKVEKVPKKLPKN